MLADEMTRKLVYLAALLAGIVLGVAAGYALTREDTSNSVTIDARTLNRVRDSLWIAQDHQGVICGGADILVKRGELRPGVFASASYRFTDGDRARPAGYYDCVITIGARGAISDDVFCTAIVHEAKHLGGYRAPPGRAFVRPDGSTDWAHSSNPRSVMYPSLRSIFPRCAKMYEGRRRAG